MGHGLRPARIWYALTMVRTTIFAPKSLCACIPRDADARAPLDHFLCRRGKQQMYLLQLRARSTRAVLLVFTVAYAPLASAVLNMWSCVNIAGTSYLSIDYRVTCDNAEWRFYAGWAVMGAILYIIGIPAACMLLVRRVKNKGVDEYLALLGPSLRALQVRIQNRVKQRADSDRLFVRSRVSLIDRWN
jgi:hypothetical protein